MKLNRSLFILFFSFISACAHPRTNWIQDENSVAQEQVKKIVLGIYNSIENKQLAGLEAQQLFGPKFTKFDLVGVAKRLDANETKKTEHNLFSSFSKAKYELMDLKVDVFEDVAISTFLLGYNVDMAGKNYKGKARGTLVFVNDGNDWKITHEHFSPFF